MIIECPECMEDMVKVKIKVGEFVNIKHYECKECGIDIRTRE